MTTTFRNINAWTTLPPEFYDPTCDIIVDGGNLAQSQPHTPIWQDVKATVLIKNANVLRCDFPANVTIDIVTCTHGHQPELPPEPEPSEIDIAKEEVRVRFEEIKPRAEKYPVAVNEVLNEVYTPEEINGVLSAKAGS